ncbi:phage tail sheath family protein [Paraherbaspirillum soli]|uniref:Phage tail sheath family protein n=1 Tax=Paraherbaspirillum soli TaxID=631222 RepID=A0ABW0M7E4_9BURK
MPVTTTYPGVYVEELPNLSLSIAGGTTAVPVIAGEAGDLTLAKPVRLNSWLDFVTAAGEADFSKTLHVGVRAYFENGGGYCYLLAADKFAAEVQKMDDVTLLVAAGQDIAGAMNTLCGSEKGRFAILDGPATEMTTSTTIPADAYPDSMHAAAYYPWLQADWATTPIPPSAAVAGLYCSVDRERGVWKAPANVSLKGGLRSRFQVSEALQGKFNTGKAINMIREFNGKGAVVWGARTLQDSDDWRYISIRRLFDTAQRDIKKAMRFAVFEPNSHPTWERVRSAVDNYLHSIWRQGGLMGSSPQEAYFVQVGKDVTMTADDVEQGKMNVKIGMAAVRPAEFIILQFTQEVGRG